MTTFQIFIGLLIMVSMIIRPFLYKPAAKLFPAEMSAAFTSTWLSLFRYSGICLPISLTKQ